MTQRVIIHVVAGMMLANVAVAAPAPSTPAKPSPAAAVKADPAAYALLKAAHDARQVMPDAFPGFDADIVFTNGDKAATGKLQYRRQEKTTFEVAGLPADDKDWLQDQVLSIIGHRRGGDFAKGDGRHPLRFGAGPDNQFGKLIELGDGMASSYRVRDNKVTEVTRTAGDTRFTISVIEFMEADPGKYLSKHFMVSYRDKNSGALQQVQGFRDAYVKQGGVWLPASRTVITFEKETTPNIRRIQFKNVQTLPAAVAAAK